jgi:hypothetical protein
MENMIGKKVKIVSHSGGNRFEIGEIVEIIGYYDDTHKDIFHARNNAGVTWYISDKDYVHIAEEKQFQISRRDLFAAAALEGMLAKRFDEPGEGVDEIILDAIEYADAIIKQLDKE